MNNKFKLQNFRVFDDKGAEFEIAPITVLTGCNSSGKSSVLKSLMLLNKCFDELITDYINGKPINIETIELLFNKGKHNLGTYNKALSKYSKAQNITFTWTKYSPLFYDPIDVELVFEGNKQNILNNAVLKRVCIRFEGKEVIELFFNENFTFKIDYLTIKDRFIQFVHRLKYFRSLQEYIGENEDGLPNQLEDEDILYDPELKINNQIIESVVFATQSLIERDNGHKLISVCNDIFIESWALFYLPLLDWLKGIKKEDVLDVVYTKMAEKNDENINNVVKGILIEYQNSSFDSFQEYYNHFENSFLKEFQVEKSMYHNMRGFEGTFLNEIDRSLSPVNSFFKPVFDIFKFENSEKVHEDSLFTKFMNLVCFCRTYDDEFNKQRVKDENHPVNGYYEYLDTKEINAAIIYLTSLIQESLIIPPSFISNIDFVDAVRANIQRIYAFNSQGSDFNDLLISYLGKSKNEKNGKNISYLKIKPYQLGSFMKKWLQKFDVSDDVIFENTSEGLGVLIYLLKDNKKELLADQGYGITQFLAILLKIEIMILKSEIPYRHPLVSTWNEGVRYKESTISIEEPETNLHPKFQSMLAEMFMDAYKIYNVRFIVETHSEYLIRKLQTLVAKKELTPDNVAIHYIYHHDKSKRPVGKPQVLNIKIKEDGRLSEPFGSGFFDEADNLAMDLLTLKSLKLN